MAEEVLEEEQEEEECEMSTCWCASVDGDICRYGYSANGFLCSYFVIRRI